MLPVASSYWYRLGVQLGVADDELDVIEQNYPRDTKLCRVKMFSTWLRNDTSATVEKLIKALAEINQASVAKEICGKYGMLELEWISPANIQIALYMFRPQLVDS